MTGGQWARLKFAGMCTPLAPSRASSTCLTNMCSMFTPLPPPRPPPAPAPSPTCGSNMCSMHTPLAPTRASPPVPQPVGPLAHTSPGPLTHLWVEHVLHVHPHGVVGVLVDVPEGAGVGVRGMYSITGLFYSGDNWSTTNSQAIAALCVLPARLGSGGVKA